MDVAERERWSLCKGSSSKFAINIGNLGIRLVVLDRLSLFRGGRLYKFNCMHMLTDKAYFAIEEWKPFPFIGH